MSVLQNFTLPLTFEVVQMINEAISVLTPIFFRKYICREKNPVIKSGKQL